MKLRYYIFLFIFSVLYIPNFSYAYIAQQPVINTSVTKNGYIYEITSLPTSTLESITLYLSTTSTEPYTTRLKIGEGSSYINMRISLPVEISNSGFYTFEIDRTSFPATVCNVDCLTNTYIPISTTTVLKIFNFASATSTHADNFEGNANIKIFGANTNVYPNGSYEAGGDNDPVKDPYFVLNGAGTESETSEANERIGFTYPNNTWASSTKPFSPYLIYGENLNDTTKYDILLNYYITKDGTQIFPQPNINFYGQFTTRIEKQKLNLLGSNIKEFGVQFENTEQWSWLPATSTLITQIQLINSDTREYLDAETLTTTLIRDNDTIIKIRPQFATTTNEVTSSTPSSLNIGFKTTQETIYATTTNGSYISPCDNLGIVSNAVCQGLALVFIPQAQNLEELKTQINSYNNIFPFSLYFQTLGTFQTGVNNAYNNTTSSLQLNIRNLDGTNRTLITLTSTTLKDALTTNDYNSIFGTHAGCNSTCANNIVNSIHSWIKTGVWIITGVTLASMVFI